MKRYVWVISDEKYGAQAVFASKQAAERAYEKDERGDYSPSGYSPAIEKFLVRD